MCSLELRAGAAAAEISENDLLGIFQLLRNTSRIDLQRELRNQIILAKRSLVIRLAMKLSRDSALRADLEGEGLVGLVEAIDRFDPAHGVPFGAYAIHFVRGRMFAVLHSSRDVRLSGRVAARVAKLRRIVRERGEPPELIGDRELAEASGLPVRTIRRLRPHIHELERMDPGLSRGPCVERVEATEEICGPSPDRAAQSCDDCATLRFAMRILSSREVVIIESAFGLTGTEKTSAEIAAWFGISRQRVDQIKQRALQKLRETGWRDMVKPHVRKTSVFGSAMRSLV